MPGKEIEDYNILNRVLGVSFGNGRLENVWK
jgi:hypothetical protein